MTVLDLAPGVVHGIGGKLQLPPFKALLSLAFSQNEKKHVRHLAEHCDRIIRM